MATSEARIAANRLNARFSTGPTSSGGKERSRLNALKHGMTGQGVALCSEDVERVQRRIDGYQAAYRPATEAGKGLVRRAAMLTVRVERCEVHEAAAISAAVRSAEADFDEARDAEVEHLIATIGDNPATNLRRLMRMPEGVETLVATWNGLGEDLAHGDGSRWGPEHSAMALHLGGRKAGGFGISRVEALSRAVGGDFSLLGEADGAGLVERGRREWARRALLALIDETVDRLGEHHATLDLEGLAADREGAAGRALFGTSKEACLARKYEAAAVRELHRTLKELREVEAHTSDRGATSPRPVSAPAPPQSPPLGSFSTGVMARPVPPPPAPPTVPVAPRSEVSGGVSYIPFSVGRPPKGSA